MEMRRSLERSQVFLLSLVSVASFFEGYDFIILSLVLPFLREDFKLSILEAGFATSIIAIGTIVAFFVVRLGDYFGRRAMLMWTVLLYTAATAATAFTNSVYGFVAMQFLARAFLVAEWGISNVMIAEELPAHKRGFGMSIVNAASGVGAVVGSALFPIVARAPLGWRTMYLIGVIPLIIVFFIRRSVKETRRFSEIRERYVKPDFTEITRNPNRRNLILIALLWFFMYLGYTPILTFYTDFAIHERGLTAREVSLIISVAFVVGLTGYVLAGKLMDLWGRRPTSVL
ncbi:MAG TPA: MFS transporter, partial [Rectinemataceae bacterium]|nr:MFS transporter [Rectinemataceae bacterium]